MKIALIQPPVWATPDPPLGPAQLAGSLKSLGHEVTVLDINILLWNRCRLGEKALWNWENFGLWNDPSFVKDFLARHSAFIEGELENILKKDIKIAAFSVCSGSQIAALEMAGLLKSARPALKNFFGGQFFFSRAKALEWIKEPAIDAIFTGAADFSMDAAARAAEKGAAPCGIPGVVSKKDGRIADGGPAEAVSDLDSLAYCDFTAFPLELYSNPVHLPFQSSRGCVWKCRFCSSCNFWPGYAQMSGERIFSETLHHKKLFPSKCHVEFYDLTANGRMSSLAKFTALRLEDLRLNGNRHFLGWKINAVVRREMSRGLLKDMHAAHCNDIIYGLESGSKSVLSLMGKNYDPAVAVEVLANTKAAGICTTANFMFGFPGETEEDFKETLSLLEKVSPHIDKAYASATFTSLEQGSYLASHPEEFGITTLPNQELHNLYWEAADGSNDYPVRLDRYKRFRSRAIDLGLDAYKGIQGDLEQETLAAVSHFHRHNGRHVAAVESLLNALDINPKNEALLRELAPCYSDLRKLLLAAGQAERLKRARDAAGTARITAKIKDTLSSLRHKAEFSGDGTITWAGNLLPPYQELAITCARAYALLKAGNPSQHSGIESPPRLPSAQHIKSRNPAGPAGLNTMFNFRELSRGQLVLASTPQRVFLQVDAPCNADCIFCSRDSRYDFFSLEKYLRTIHPKIRGMLRRAREVIFTGSGELLLLPDAPGIIGYFNRLLPHAEKQLATNASHLNREIWGQLCAPSARYTLQISLHAASRETHKKVTGLDAFDAVMENLSFLAGNRKKTGWPRLHLMCVLTTANIRDIVDFVRLGARLGVDRVIANHAYIYRKEQEQFSLHHIQREADDWLGAARKTAEELGIAADLPAGFGKTKHSYPGTDCREPWSQIMINSKGDILPCDLYGDFAENILRKDFMGIWNGEAFVKCRRDARDKTGCYLKCPRHNPASLARIESLKITRG